jgi:hypothetical protein
MPPDFSKPSLKESLQAARSHRCPWCGDWTPGAKGIFCPPCWRGMPAERQEAVRWNLRIGSPTSAQRIGLEALRDAARAGTFKRLKFERTESEVES